jgi:hypothetical protein
VALLVAAPVAAHAQFATFIPPKPKEADSVAERLAAAQRARTERTTAARIAAMKAWVDSAAGLPPRPSRVSDTELVPPDTTKVQVATANGRLPQPIITAPGHTDASAVENRPVRAPVGETRAGARAPATASELPLLLLLGSLALVFGLALIASTPRGHRGA